jgi:hypothetical protein
MVDESVVEAAQGRIGTFARQPFLVQISKNDRYMAFEFAHILPQEAFVNKIGEILPLRLT